MKPLNPKIAKLEKSISHFVPYSRHVDDATLRTKDGELLCVIKLRGAMHETASNSDLNHLHSIRTNCIKAISDPRFVMYHHMIRKRDYSTLEAEYENTFCAQLHTAYQNDLQNKKLFNNTHYITLVLRPAQGVVGLQDKIKRSLFKRVDHALYEETLQNDLKYLGSETRNLVQSLAAFEPELLKVTPTEHGNMSPALSFISYLLNLDDQLVPALDAGIDTYLPRKRLLFGKDAFECRGAIEQKYGVMLSVKKFSSHTVPGMLDFFSDMPHEFILTQSFAGTSTQDVLDRIDLTRRQMISGEQGAETLIEELSDAHDNVASCTSVFGEYHFSICAHASDTKELERAIGKLSSVIKPTGMHIVRDDVNMEPLFWAQLPANLSYIGKKSLVSSENFSAFMALYNLPLGRKTNNQWGDAVTCFETTSSTPYWFNFHNGDNGNFMLTGPAGWGKTALLSFLHAQAQKFQPRSFIFDSQRGLDAYVGAIGGDYAIVKPGTGTGFNPLHIEDTPENRAFLRQWFALILRNSDGTPLTVMEKRIIAEAVDTNFDAPLSQRYLSVLEPSFGGYDANGESLIDRLAMWHGTGERAWLFDNQEDTLSLSNMTNGFDMTSILQDAESRTPWLLYVFHRIKTSLDGRRVMIVLDEAWKLLNDPFFSEVIKEWILTIRKENGFIVFTTQDVHDAAQSTIASTLIQQIKTKLYIGNPDATYEDYCDAFNLTRYETDTIRNMSREKRCFLIKQGSDSVIAKLDLSELSSFMPILSGRSEHHAALDAARAQYPNANDWVPDFIERVSA